ncbi:MAG: carbon-nitrogen hydrolase family protein [Deltaproteobacteria bacterium]|nr:carbon-nitrogen hydrolase family protein [Deltaproteobacteria bacterium]
MLRFRHYSIGIAAIFLAAGLASGCSDDTTPPQSDAMVDQRGPGADIAPDITPDTAPATSLKVAGVQYSSGNHTAVKECSDDFCALEHFIREATQKGAKIIATPEGAQDQKESEASPAIDDLPATDARWGDTTILRRFSKLAIELKVTITFNLVTQKGPDATAKLFNTNVAIGPAGKVVARHEKFQLFGGEKGYYTPGDSVKDSFFQTPAGLASMMICADAQCIVTGLSVSPDCTAHAIDMIKDFFDTKPKIVFFSSFWTVGGSGQWAALNVQKLVAKEGKVWLVAANNTKGEGKGGAIYDPTGAEIAKLVSETPGVIYADIPLK